MQFDISNFYPSIIEDLLMAAGQELLHFSIAMEPVRLCGGLWTSRHTTTTWRLRYTFDSDSTDCTGTSELYFHQSQQIDRIRKQLMKFFKNQGINIATITNSKVINFLDTTFDLSRRIRIPYNKQLYNHIYINKESNHSPGIHNNLHKSIQHGLSTKSSNKYLLWQIQSNIYWCTK